MRVAHREKMNLLVSMGVEESIVGRGPVGVGKRTKAQRLRDRGKVMELHAVGFSEDQIVERMRGVTARDGYYLTAKDVQVYIREGMTSLEGVDELNRAAYRTMMLSRFKRRRAQLEEIIEEAREERVETQVRRRDIAGSGRQAAKVPIAGYTEATEKRKKGFVPIVAFEQLTAIDRLEMDLLGLQLKPEQFEDAPDLGEFVTTKRAIDYDDAARLLMDGMASAGQIPNLVVRDDITKPTLVKDDPEEDIIEGVLRSSH